MAFMSKKIAFSCTNFQKSPYRGRGKPPGLPHPLKLSLSSGRCPYSLNIAKVIPIFKKGDPSEKKYRPISLLPSMSTILERLVYKRLYYYLLNNNILIPNQFGFRKCHSTDLAIIQLCDKIIESFINTIIENI